MASDYKKEYKEFYMPKNKPSIVTIPGMNYIAVRGHGDPNAEDGEYKQSIGLLYGIAFTIKMSKKGDHQIDGYFDYVVPPLEGFWWQDGVAGIDYAHKENFEWISVIRLPDFVTKVDFDWAIEEATKKKKTDFSKVEFLTYDEGLCVQCIHIGSYDDEPATVALMHEYMEQQGYVLDITEQRLHHEIYLSDARKVAPEKLKNGDQTSYKESVTRMNVILEKWTHEFKPELIKICNEVDRSYLSNRLPYPYTEESADWWLGMVSEHDGKDGIFRAIVADGKIVGNISVEQKSDVYCKDGEIGYLLLTDCWSKGIMTEAVRQICVAAFLELDIIRITGLVYAPNVASQRVLEKNSFIREGTQKSAVYKNGQIYDLFLYAKLK